MGSSNNLYDSSGRFAAGVIDDCDKIIKDRINSLREKGYSDDEILLLLFNDGFRPSSNSDDKSSQTSKTKRFTYTSDIHNK